MNFDLWAVISIVAPLLLIEGFFSGSEIALLSVDKLLLKSRARRGSHSSALAFELTSHPERILSVTLLMTSFCVIGISAFIAIYLISHALPHAELWAILITSPSVVLFGELIPKTIYQRYADQIAPWAAYPVNWIYWAFFPITRLLSSYTSQLSRLIGPIEEMLTGKRRTTRDELRSLLGYGRRETELKTSERRMIRRILDFKDSEAKNALIPLVDVEAIDSATTVKDAIEEFKRHRHSRMPVYSERVDNIIGILEISDLFAVTSSNEPIVNYITNAHYVSETQALHDLLIEMHEEDNEMVVVVDEYGGAVGIITFEDIVEEIVGEIHDEHDSKQALYKQLSESSWLVQARMQTQKINERLHLDIPEGNYETLGGFLLQQFGRIPDVRDELYFETPSASLKLTVRKANERQIESVLIERVAEKNNSKR